MMASLDSVLGPIPCTAGIRLTWSFLPPSEVGATIAFIDFTDVDTVGRRGEVASQI